MLHSIRLVAYVLTAVMALAVMAACSSSETSQEDPAAEALAITDSVTTETKTANTSADPQPLILLNQQLIEGYAEDDLDPRNINAMFWAVFSGIPEDVIVYPSENYYYFKMFTGGQQFWGNIRLPAGERDEGVLAFGYFEFNDVPPAPGTRFSRFKTFKAEDGLILEKINRFTYQATYKGKTVTFNLFQLDQQPPQLFTLGTDELFIQRTFDESGYQFFLLFNERLNYFFWVLNEEENVPDILDSQADDLVMGRRSGFAFWIDKANGDRKILAAISQINVSRNNYFDGPFDQLADNYAEEVQIAKYMQLANPSLEGRIDQFGYFNDTDRPLRVSLSHYYRYTTDQSLDAFVSKMRTSDDPHRFISRRGAP